MTHFWWAGVVAGALWTSVAWIAGLFVAGVVREWQRQKRR